MRFPARVLFLPVPLCSVSQVQVLCECRNSNNNNVHATTRYQFLRKCLILKNSCICSRVKEVPDPFISVCRKRERGLGRGVRYFSLWNANGFPEGKGVSPEVHREGTQQAFMFYIFISFKPSILKFDTVAFIHSFLL